MIAQHHERLNGTGLPLGLQEDEISLLSQIVMVVDEYDDLCNLSENRHHVTPHEILSQMYRDVTINKIHAFNGEILVTLIQLLGVYPPGTLVELNDGKMGVVVNINAINRSKPQVLLYTPHGGRKEAVVIDLGENDDLHITRSLPPATVSSNIRQYLSPHRMTAYFPKTSDIPTFSG